MVDVARLGLAVDSSQVEKGTVTLHQLTGAAGQASAAAQRLAGATNAEAAGHKVAASATQVHTAAIHANNAAMRLNTNMRTNMIFQLNDVAVSLASGMNPALVAMQQGSQMLQFGFGPALNAIGDIAVGVVTKFGPLLAVFGAATALLYGFTRQINEANDSNVSMVDTALAMWESLAGAVQTTLGPALTWLGDEFNRAIDQITVDTTREINFIIGAFAGSVEAIKAVWGVLPDALGFIIYDAAQKTVNGVIYMVREVQVHLNDVLTDVNSLMAKAGMAPLALMNLSPYVSTENPYAGAGSAVDAAGDAFNSAMGKDYVGDWMKGIGGRAQEIAAARAETEELGGAAKAANDNVKKLADDGMTKAFDVAKGLSSAFQGVGKGIFDAFKKGGDVASSVLEMLMGKLEQFATSWLDNIVNNGIDTLFSSFGSFGIGGGMRGTSSITGSSGGFFPAFANGTNYAPGGLSWVGERGPELVNLPRGAQVFNHQQSMGIAANQNRPISVQTNIINNAGVEVVERTYEDGQGGVRQEIVLNRAVANAVAKPGPAQKAVRNAGQLVRR